MNMKASLLQEHLLTPLAFVGKNVSLKTQLPIAQHVLITTEKGRLRLSTTNTEKTKVTSFAGNG